jgi:hypothetical protein
MKFYLQMLSFSSEKTAYWKTENRAITNLSILAPLKNTVGLTIKKISSGWT